MNLNEKPTKQELINAGAKEEETGNLRITTKESDISFCFNTCNGSSSLWKGKERLASIGHLTKKELKFLIKTLLWIDVSFSEKQPKEDPSEKICANLDDIHNLHKKLDESVQSLADKVGQDIGYLKAHQENQEKQLNIHAGQISELMKIFQKLGSVLNLPQEDVKREIEVGSIVELVENVGVFTQFEKCVVTCITDEHTLNYRICSIDEGEWIWVSKEQIKLV